MSRKLDAGGSAGRPLLLLSSRIKARKKENLVPKNLVHWYGPVIWLPWHWKTRAASGDFESLVPLGEPEYRVGMQPFLPHIPKLVGHSPDKEE